MYLSRPFEDIAGVLDAIVNAYFSRSFGSWFPISAYRSSYLRRFPPLRMTSHDQSPAPSIHLKGATHEPYQTKSRSCCSGAPCVRDGVFLGGQPFLAEREYQFPAPRAPFFSHDHRSGSSARRILQRSFLPSLSEAHE